ncbi:MAG: phosphodiesterase [Pseudomonadota bacterium]
MAFIQLTDLHFVPPGERLFGTDPAERLAAAVDLINAEHDDAEFVLISGDLTHRGERAAYELLRDTLAPLALPVHLMVGNHDDREVLASVFDVPRDGNGFVQFVIDAEDTPIVCLDTLVDEQMRSDGVLCRQRLDWLAARVGELRRPWVLAMHHPPLTLGLPNMDRIRLDQASSDALGEILAPNPPRLMLLGHVHRPIHGTWRGIPFHIHRGINHQVAYRAGMEKVLMFSDEPAELAIISLNSGDAVIHTRVCSAPPREFASN